MPRKRKYPKSARTKRTENQLFQKNKVKDEAPIFESDGVSSSLGDVCNDVFVNDSNNMVVNEGSTRLGGNDEFFSFNTKAKLTKSKE